MSALACAAAAALVIMCARFSGDVGTPIVGEVEVRVEHHLLALPTCTMERVRRIYSHPQALAQCDRFLRTLSGVEVIATYDTAGSANSPSSSRRRS